MAQLLTSDAELTPIADAIRAKSNTTSKLVYPNGFTSAINSISKGEWVEKTFEDETVSFILLTTSGKPTNVTFRLFGKAVPDPDTARYTTNSQKNISTTKYYDKGYRLCHVTNVSKNGIPYVKHAFIKPNESSFTEENCSIDFTSNYEFSNIGLALVNRSLTLFTFFTNSGSATDPVTTKNVDALLQTYTKSVKSVSQQTWSLILPIKYTITCYGISSEITE